MSIFTLTRPKRATGPIPVPDPQIKREDGQTRLAQSPYILPIGVEESDRLLLQEYLIRRRLKGQLHRCPLDETAPKRVLDVACGTGQWVRAMSKQYPNATIEGMDLNKAPWMEADKVFRRDFPKTGFIHANALEPWPMMDEQYGMVHAQMVSPFVPKDRWTWFLKEAYRVLGWMGSLEILDFGPVWTHVQGGGAFSKVVKGMEQLAGSRSLYPYIGPKLPALLAQAGFEQVSLEHWTIGMDPKDRFYKSDQRLLKANFLAIIQQMAPGLMRLGIVTPEFWPILLEQVQKEMDQGLSWTFSVAWGQKCYAFPDHP